MTLRGITSLFTYLAYPPVVDCVISAHLYGVLILYDREGGS